MVKQATKGQKEIYEENISTLKGYSIATIISVAVYFMSCQFMWECSSTSYIYFVITVAIQLGALLMMKTMAAAKFDDRGHVVDAGMDLNCESAFGEYCKDAIILTVITQAVALYSNYGYLILLAFPGAIGYKFVFSLLIPWVTAPSGSEEEVDEKKLRKRDRREKIVYRR